MYLTQSEMEIMQAFWKCDRSMSLSELKEVSPNRTWKDRSVFSMINNLIKKGFLKEDSFVHSGKTIARTFAPIISCTEYMISQFGEYSDKIDYTQLLTGLLGDKDIDPNDIDELDKLISMKKRELKKK
ncbi:Predicted transcriptional regulator [Butyrivibrio sp. ob235]|uniref:BlaI/MecI/CopY family transcriptional regulator n=1 Tax=Butyrivibrio sp. ob235 TaxID=1761780 RepID=UPI0008CFF960|nr:BlaI/MecI/CopY family transcriptional regulator [Butyrivibrio sp. ob235]SEL14544.1 Predicted transcriptional regulator [Butyrivibrio sp. ob235]